MTIPTAARRLPSVLLSLVFAVTAGCVRVPARQVVVRVPEVETATPPLLGELVALPEVVPADAPVIPREFRGVWVAAVSTMMRRRPTRINTGGSVLPGSSGREFAGYYPAGYCCPPGQESRSCGPFYRYPLDVR